MELVTWITKSWWFMQRRIWRFWCNGEPQQDWARDDGTASGSRNDPPFLCHVAVPFGLGKHKRCTKDTTLGCAWNDSWR